jgi:hypothetical protein
MLGPWLHLPLLPYLHTNLEDVWVQQDVQLWLEHLDDLWHWAIEVVKQAGKCCVLCEPQCCQLVFEEGVVERRPHACSQNATRPVAVLLNWFVVSADPIPVAGTHLHGLHAR